MFNVNPEFHNVVETPIQTTAERISILVKTQLGTPEMFPFKSLAGRIWFNLKV